ncbi:MAG: hypothetical protein DI606_00300 [Sphingobium sp.]|nr:MAG: hypothetical protein DI606_00300 [Sphingobium sp.]
MIPSGVKGHRSRRQKGASNMRVKVYRLIAAALTTATWPVAAWAQESVLVDTAIPDSFNRDRNVSVTERARPDFDPLGIIRGAFTFLPQVQAGVGVSDNVFLTRDSKRSDGYGYFAPAITMTSDLPRDEIRASARAVLGRWFKYDNRNQNTFDLRLLGRKDIGDAYSVTGEAQYARIYEQPNSGAVDPSTAVLSAFNRSYFAVRGRYAFGRVQATVGVDRTAFTFDDLTLANGTPINQDSRDQVQQRLTAELQYALSPSLSIYGQVGGSKIEYSTMLFNVENRDSKGLRIVGGFNFDLAGLMRGKLGAGYIERDYDSPLYKDAHGVSVEGQVEFFPTELTTVGVAVARTLRDTNLAFNTGAFFDNSVTARVDHELLVNLLLGASGEYRHQVYLGTPTRADYYRASGTATYFANRSIVLRGEAGWQRRTINDNATNRFSEFRGELSITFRR